MGIKWVSMSSHKEMGEYFPVKSGILSEFSLFNNVVYTVLDKQNFSA